MPSASFDKIIDKYPKEERAIKRLASLFDRPEGTYTFEHLYHKISPTSPETLSLVLADLADQGFVEKIIRVESPSHKGGIEEFRSLADVPEEIYDWRTDQELKVQPDHLRVLFKLRRE